MKKIIILLILCLHHHAHGTVSFEYDASAFFPTNQTVRTIYGKVWQNYGITFDHIQPFKKRWHPLSFFGKVNFLFSHGRSENGSQSTNIKLIPLTFGLQWIHKIYPHIEVYGAIAPRYYVMKTTNTSLYVPHTSHTHGCGAYVSVGSFFYPVDDLMINIFFDYSYKKFKAPTSTSLYQGFATNVSGLNLGGGIGWQF